MVFLLLPPLLTLFVVLPFCESFNSHNNYVHPSSSSSLRIAKIMTCTTRYNDDGHPPCCCCYCCYNGASRTTKKKHLTLQKMSSSSTNNNNNNDNDEKENDDEIFFYDDFSGQSIGEVVVTNNNPLLEQQDDKEVVIVEDDALLLLPDFDDDDEDTKNDDNNMSSREVISIPLPKQVSTINDDMTGSTLREFSFGPDVLLSNYAGSLGFDKVTDWQYYTTNEYTGEKQSVNPRPLDPTQPTRTRSSSGSVVRLFRGELGGLLGSKLRSRGLDGRVWIKEYSGTEALQLAQCEKRGLGKLQSSWLKQHLQQQKGTSNTSLLLLQQMQDGEWINEAQRRYVNGLTDTPTNKDDENLITLLELVSKQRAPFASLLGELNLNDYWDDDESEYSNNNEWYKSLGVKPPRPGSVWLIFDYHGISTAASYAVPSIIQRSKLPPKRGPFGGIVEAPPLPPFKERARYMVQGVLKGMLSAVASAHEAGIVHRSIGRNSFILSSVGQDKREATSPYAVVLPRLRVILSDFGFSAPVEEAMLEKELGVRSRMFGIPGVVQAGGSSTNDRTLVASEAFTMAEDLHALGFVFLALLFTTLSEPATLSAPMPPTDDDAWQRLFFEIFDKDMDNFRDYCANEEVWDNVVELLDRENGAGWDLLGDLLLARERLGEWYNDNEREGMILDQTAKGLLSHPFFQMKII